MGFKEEKVSVRDGMFNVTVRRGGSGDPLVFLHAAGGQAAWDPFLEMLSQKYEVIVPIHPGWPGSEGLSTWTTSSTWRSTTATSSTRWG